MCFLKARLTRRVPGMVEVGDRLCAEYSALALAFLLSSNSATAFTAEQVQRWMEQGCPGLEACDCPFALPSDAR